MNKVYGALFLGVMLILSIGAVSASTLVAGKIYNSDYSATIAGADVTVTCNGVTQPTTQSLDDGTYKVTYAQGCDVGDSLTVYAVKGSQFGTKTGEIHDFTDTIGWDLGIVNVPLVPEFGIGAGAVTILGALAIFFVVRKK